MRTIASPACIMLAGVSLFIPGLLPAQSVGGAQIGGVITDPSGALVPGAQVKATQTDTGQVRATVSTPNGSYVLPNLAVGPYSLEVTSPGLRPVCKLRHHSGGGQPGDGQRRLAARGHEPGCTGFSGCRHGPDAGYLRLRSGRPAPDHRSASERPAADRPDPARGRYHQGAADRLESQCAGHYARTIPAPWPSPISAAVRPPATTT